MPHGVDKNELKVTSSDKSNGFNFTREPNQSKPPCETQKGGSHFVFGNIKAKKTLKDSDKVSNVPNKRRRRRPRRRKVNQFALRNQELEIEKDKRKQRRHTNWNKRQRSKIGRVTKVRALNSRLTKMMSRPKRKRKGTSRPVCTTTKFRRQTNKEERVTSKVTKRPIRTTYLLEKEEPCMLCLEKRQQSSPAVMFARLRSNRRYKPGD